MGSYLNGVYRPSVLEVGWDAEVSDALTQLGRRWIDVTSAPYGADPTGAIASTNAIQAAIDDAIVGGAAAANARTVACGVFIPPGLYKIDAPLQVYSVIGFELRGAGIGQTFLMPSDDMAQLLDLNGLYLARIHGFNIGGTYQGATSVTNLVDLYWDPDSSARSTNFVKFSEIAAFGTNWEESAFRLARTSGGIYAGNPNSSQNDHIVYERCQVVGQGPATPAGVVPTNWQAAFWIGTGAPGNTLESYIKDCEPAAVGYGVYVESVPVWVSNHQCGASNADFKTVGAPNIVVSGVRSERSQRLLQTGNNSATANCSFRDVIYEGDNLASDGRIVDINSAGNYNFENVRMSRHNIGEPRPYFYLGNPSFAAAHLELTNVALGGTSPVNAVQVANAYGEAHGVGVHRHDIGGAMPNSLEEIAGEWWYTSTGARRRVEGTGTPEGVVTANIGSQYVDTVTGVPYVKRAGVGNTGWGAVTVASATALPAGTTATNLIGWFNAGAIEDIDDTEFVPSWPDASGLNVPLRQSDVDLMPTWRDAVVNGEPVVRWTTGDEYLFAIDHGIATALAGSDHASTIFAVFKRASNRSDPDVPFRLTGGNAVFYPVYTGGTAGNVLSQRQDDSLSNVTLTSAAGAGAAAFHVWSAKFTGTAMTVYKDGGSGVTSITAAAMNVGTVSHDSLFMGLDDTFRGDVAEILVYDTALADTPRQEVQTYLGTKYNITIT